MTIITHSDWIQGDDYEKRSSLVDMGMFYNPPKPGLPGYYGVANATDIQAWVTYRARYHAFDEGSPGFAQGPIETAMGILENNWADREPPATSTSPVPVPTVPGAFGTGSVFWSHIGGMGGYDGGMEGGGRPPAWQEGGAPCVIGFDRVQGPDDDPGDDDYRSETNYFAQIKAQGLPVTSAHAAWWEPDIADAPPGTVGFEFQDGQYVLGEVLGGVLSFCWKAHNQYQADGSPLIGGDWQTTLSAYDPTSIFTLNSWTEPRPIFRADSPGGYSLTWSEYGFRTSGVTPLAILDTVGRVDQSIFWIEDIDLAPYLSHAARGVAHAFLATHTEVFEAPSLGPVIEPVIFSDEWVQEGGGMNLGAQSAYSTFEYGHHPLPGDVSGVMWTIRPPVYRWIIELEEPVEPEPEPGVISGELTGAWAKFSSHH